MTTVAPSTHRRLRWDEFLPLRGKWARWLLLLPLLAGLWVLWGARIELPGWFSFETVWYIPPAAWANLPDAPDSIQPRTFTDSSCPIYYLGHQHQRTFKFDAREYRVTWWTRLPGTAARLPALPHRLRQTAR